MAGSQDSDYDFCTLGMFIIDEIHPSSTSAEQVAQCDIVGGAGTYSAIGARLFSPPPLSRSIGWVVDAGVDFPSEVLSTISSWETGAYIRERPALTTRGWNGYTTPTHRAFKYLTPKLRLTPADLLPAQLTAKSIHLICSPARCISQCELLSVRRQEILPASPPTLKIWEPVPDLCIPAELEATYAALAHVDVISPNHEELASLYGSPPSAHEPEIDRELVAEQAAQIMNASPPSDCRAIVVRCASAGVYLYNPREKIARWMPAYFTEPSRVVDPTGAGNGFLGGLAVGLVRTGGDLVEAVRWGMVSAAFCLEQVGPPVLSHSADASTNGSSERWNDASVLERLDAYRSLTS